MKKINIKKTLLFTFVGGVLPLIFVYLVSFNQISFIGSRTILGMALAMLIIICAATVGFRFKALTKGEKIINIILGTILYTIIYIIYMKVVIQPEATSLINLILTGYYGVIASIIAIILRSNEEDDTPKQHKYFKERRKK